MSFPYQAKDIVLVRVACGNIYYAKIVTVNREDEECLAEFDDGSKASVPWQNIFDVKAETDVIVCVVCKDGTSDTPNEIILCDSCNVGYHQNCHRTLITSAHIAQEKWFCFFCLNKKKNPYLKNPFDEKKERLMKERLARRELNIQPLQEQRPGKRVRQKTKEETKNRPPAKRQALDHHQEHPKHHNDYATNGSSKPSSKCTNKKPLSQKAQQQYKDFNKKLKNPIKSTQSKPGSALKSRPMTITPQNLSPQKRLSYPVPLDLPPLVKSPCTQKGSLISPSYQPPPLFKADITSSEHHLFSQLKKLTKLVSESSSSEHVPQKSPLISPPKTNIFDSPIFKISPKKGKELSPPKPQNEVKKVLPPITYNQKNISLEIDRMYENIQNAHFSLNTLSARSALLEQNTTARLDETIQNILGITPPLLSTPSKAVPEPVQAVPKFPDYKPSLPQFPMFKLPEVEKKPEPSNDSTPPVTTNGFNYTSSPKPNGVDFMDSTPGKLEEKGDISVCKAEVMELKAEVMNLEAEIMDFKAGSYSEQPSEIKTEKRTETLEDCLELEAKLEPLPSPVSRIDDIGAKSSFGLGLDCPSPAMTSLPRSASRPSTPATMLDQIKIVSTEAATSSYNFNAPSPSVPSLHIVSSDYASSPSPPFAQNLQQQLRIVSTEPASLPPSLSYISVTTPPNVATEIHPSTLTVSNVLDAAQPYITITPNLDNLIEPSQTISIQQSLQQPLLEQQSIQESILQPLLEQQSLQQQSFSISQATDIAMTTVPDPLAMTTVPDPLAMITVPDPLAMTTVPDPLAMTTVPDPLAMPVSEAIGGGLFGGETPVVQFTLFSNYSAFFDSDNEDEDKPSAHSEAQSSSNIPTTSDNGLDSVHQTEETKHHSNENSENHTPNNIPQIKQPVELEHSAIHRRECAKPTLAPFS